jgi:hypothetical protein
MSTLERLGATCVDGVEQGLHRRVLADDVPEGVALPEALSQQGVSCEEARLLHGALDHGDEGSSGRGAW